MNAMRSSHSLSHSLILSLQVLIDPPELIIIKLLERGDISIIQIVDFLPQTLHRLPVRIERDRKVHLQQGEEREWTEEALQSEI